MICFGAEIIGPRMIQDILSTFLNAKFSTEEKYRRRVRKLKLDMMDAPASK
jgi:ribose 5-phosphate isomerase B